LRVAGGSKGYELSLGSVSGFSLCPTFMGSLLRHGVENLDLSFDRISIIF